MSIKQKYQNCKKNCIKSMKRDITGPWTNARRIKDFGEHSDIVYNLRSLNTPKESTMTAFFKAAT